MIDLKIRIYLHCKCERKECGHEWDSFQLDENGDPVKPDRCAGCKYRLSWNGEDHRRTDPYKFAAAPDPLANGKVPQLDPNELLKDFTDTKDILEQLISDYGPCNHPKECVCHETRLLARVNRQIAMFSRLAKLTGKKKKNAVAKAV